MSTLLELAERCEAATGPDRELDGRIWCALKGNRFVRFVRHDERVPWSEIEGGRHSNYASPGMVFENLTGKGGRFQQFSSSPAYTASVDAALTLVLEGWRIDGMRDHIIPKPYTAVGIVCGSDRAHGKAVTRALAICAAALRTRAV